MHTLAFLIPILFVVVIYIARIVELRTRRDTIKGNKQESVSLILFIATGTLMFLGAMLEYVLQHKTFSWPFMAAGVLCAVLSFKLRRSAILALGKFWSLHVEIRNEHQFVTSGPFRWVRHPTYLSMILELLAAGLALQAFLTMIIVIPVLFVPTLLYRIKIEEAALVAKFGESYREYQKVVPALFPAKLPLVK